MSLKDLFNEEKNLKSLEPVTKDDFKEEIESFDYAHAIQQRDARFIATENFNDPTVFARYGSAEKYYQDSIARIYNTYPYDGSLKEKILWEVSSSLLDLYLFENGYPRTTGYANFVTPSTTTGADIGLNNVNFMPPDGDDEYILVKGGPHPGAGTSLHYDNIKKEVVYRDGANIFDLSEERENNLLIDGTRGNTIEFWLKKDTYDPVTKPENIEFIFDTHVTGTTYTSADYGRLMVGLCTTGTVGNADNQPIILAFASGSDRTELYLGASTLTSASIADGNWHHYAIRLKTSGSDTVADLFVDGQHNDKSSAIAQTIDYVSGALVATIGAQAAPFFDSFAERGERGWSKFSGSLDEVRYWKTWRSSKQIQRYWFDQVGGGSNSDLSNTDLGVYFKFNEGITQTSSIDSIALDYSGRISNGTWIGYNSASSRNVGSAINEADSLMTSFSGSEFRDPIIYSNHPEVVTFLSNMESSGSIHDDTNPNSLISYIPSWIIEENQTAKTIKDKDYLWNLLQIIASYFDEATLLIDKLPELSHKKYYSGVANPPPFNKFALESSGFITPEIFVNAELLEQFEDRDDTLKFEKTLQEVKNTIYQNIYNNLTYIYKSKGTEKAFRNLFHCFGFGEEVLKFNIYGNNATYKLEDNLKFRSKIKNYVNFNEIANSDASVYQYQIDSNATSYISGTSKTDGTFEGAGLSFTLESNVILPNRVSIAQYSTVKKSYENNKVANLYPAILSSSLFGMHTANGTENDLTWDSNDYANFQVYTVKDDQFSSNAYFKLSSTDGGVIPELTSSYFEDVYDDQLWTVAVTVEPSKYPMTNQVSGTADSTYTVKFYGVNFIADYKAQEFLVTGTITNQEGRQFLSRHKRIYAGAHRTNFTGSVRTAADSKINGCKAWISSPSTGTIDNHNLKLGTFGSESPTKNAFLYQDSVNGINIPENKTLALLWDFTTTSGSNSNGQFAVEDETSGSASANNYGWLSNVISRRHTASGSFFETSSTNALQQLDRSTYQTQLPEILMDSNLTRILSQDDEFFNRNTRPVTYHMSIEKNMFQDISEDMLNMFGSVVYFNKLIGSPENIYRGEYKELKKAADLYFEKVDNDYDFDKYVEYFKFIDYAVSRYVMKLIPISMLTFEDGISTVVENFVLSDRNKFQSKFPIIKDVRPQEIVGEVLGINELLYDWKHGHAPLSNEEENNCLWWKERAAKDNSVITSGDSNVDSDRQSLLDAELNETDAAPPTLYDSETSQTYEGSTYATRRLAKTLKLSVEPQPMEHGGTNFNRNRKVDFLRNFLRPDLNNSDDYGLIVNSDYIPTSSCDDETIPPEIKKTYQHFPLKDIADTWQYSDRFIAPFNIMSASQELKDSGGGSLFGTNKYQITNIHFDGYGDDAATPMQGPFTNAHVGGSQHRHIPVNTGSDDINTRPELFRFRNPALDTLYIYSPDFGLDGFIDPDLPRASYYRDEISKRPVNIKNIKSTTGSAILGNFSQNYEIVMTNGRTINNRYMAESDGALARTTTTSSFLSGTVEFDLPRRDLTGSSKSIIVNRFSAPGDPSTMAEGMLDIAAGEYSVYNVLPFRNLNVRLSLQELLSDHSEQFGYFSDWFTQKAYERAGEAYPGGNSEANALNYDGTGSFHKVNRNTRKYLQYSNEFVGSSGIVNVSESYDNAYVQHAIPQTDAQYAWITASLIENYTGAALYGYEEKNFSRADLASGDLIFVSSSDLGVYPAATNQWLYGYTKTAAAASAIPHLPISFVNLNVAVLDAINSSNNLLGNPNVVYDVATGNGYNQSTIIALSPGFGVNPAYTAYLNSILLHRQGPYGGANWKLYRKDNHPIVRYQKNNNILGSLFNEEIINFTEPPITSKYKPFLFETVSEEIDVRGKNVISKALVSHGNIKSYFTDHTKEQLSTGLNFSNLDIIIPDYKSKLLMSNPTYSAYSSYKLYVDQNINRENVQATYVETIYPKGLYTYLSGTRKRLNFANDFWRDEREDRTKDNLVNSTNNIITLASIWKLDAHKDYLSDNVSSSIPYSGGMTQLDAVGELQNCYSLFHYQTPSDIVPATNYNRRIKLLHPDTFLLSNRTEPFFQNGEDLSDLPFIKGRTDAPNPRLLSGAVGDTLWEASSSNGEKPFYDSYDDYAEVGFRNLKNGTILPEFRISNRIDDFVSAGVNLNFENYNPSGFFDVAQTGDNTMISTGLLSLTGSSIISPETDTADFLLRYTFSDFYKYFKLVKEDFNSDIAPHHKLTCNGIVKFLPYNGFYPSERCVQLGNIFSQSADVVLEGSNGSLRTAMQPFYAPGVLFNSIKSGIAVDYPIFNSAVVHAPSASVVWGSSISGNFDQRVTIDDLLNPKGIRIADSEVDKDLAINSSASINDVEPKYTFAVSNFLAESMNLFISEDNYSSIDSVPFDPTEDIQVDTTGIYSMNLVLRNSTNIVTEANFSTAKDDMQNTLQMALGVTDATAQLSASYPYITSSISINSSSVTMYDRGITNYNLDAFLYGSSFGPPVESGMFASGGFGVIAGGGYQLTASGGPVGTSFDPYTPSYYNGYSRVRIDVSLDAGEFYQLGQVVSMLTYSYDRLNTFRYPVIKYDDVNNIETNSGALDNILTTTAYRNAMQLSASILTGDGNANSIIYENEFISNGSKIVEQVLSFKPRWECPVLDLSSSSPTFMPELSGNIAKGMWHQYGETPINKGIIFEVQNDVNDDSKFDLTKVLKINSNQSTYIGKANQRKNFSEAIIAIPFKYNNSKSETMLYNVNSSMTKFILDHLYPEGSDKMDPFAPIRSYTDVNNLYKNKAEISLIEGTEPSSAKENQDIKEKLNIDKSLYDLIVMMKKYVIPPHLDWTHNSNISPFTMFMMEFEIDLNETDIKNIWQNIEPTFAKKALKFKTETNSHLLPITKNDSATYFNNDPLTEENTRWAVFKVKKRAKTNYNSVVGKVNIKGVDYSRSDLKNNLDNFLYSYNWPYDFFSLIELANVDSFTSFNPIYKDDGDLS